VDLGAYETQLIRDTDGDGLADWWMLHYFGHPTGLASDNSRAQDSAAGDGVSNLQKYLLGKNPLIWDNLHFVGVQPLPDGQFQLTVYGELGRSYVLEASTNLVTWIPILNFACTNSPLCVADPAAANYAQRFYRIARLTSVPRPQLGFGSTQPLTSSGLDLSLAGLPGFSYRIEVSTNLVDWAPLTTFLSTNAIMLFRDATATNFNQRFYRAVVP
jgi:hypothetical protein